MLIPNILIEDSGIPRRILAPVAWRKGPTGPEKILQFPHKGLDETEDDEVILSSPLRTVVIDTNFEEVVSRKVADLFLLCQKSGSGYRHQ